MVPGEKGELRHICLFPGFSLQIPEMLLLRVLELEESALCCAQMKQFSQAASGRSFYKQEKDFDSHLALGSVNLLEICSCHISGTLAGTLWMQEEGMTCQ